VSERTLDQYSGRWGVVSLFSVLEHVRRPNIIKRDIAKIQSKGDNLVVEVPHYPSISAASQISFPEQVNGMMHPPLHLLLFSFAAIQKMLRNYDYKVKAVWYFGQDFYEMFSTLGLFNKGLNDSALDHALAPLVNDLQNVIDEHSLSDEMLIVAEKIS
jgi:hypothetical protein